MADELWKQVARVLDQIPIDFGGGCSVSKAYLMAWLIRRYAIRCTVDIGVYRGRSLFPQAVAHRDFTGGRVYGVDPWSPIEAAENDNEPLRERIRAWSASTDWDALHAHVESMRGTLHVPDSCTLLRSTSSATAARFRADGTLFGLIHIDGNHDTRQVLEDVRAYRPLLQAGGFIVLDDVSWDSVRPAYDELGRSMRHVFESRSQNDYAVFYDGGAARALWLRAALAVVGRNR